MSTHSPDYQFYKDYFDYFYGVSQDTNREQGLLYFFLVSLSIKLGPQNFGGVYTEQLISNAIQLTNLLIYILGLIGLYFLFRLKELKLHQIYLVFSVLNFLPQTINLILTMKPEILAFSLITWSFFLFEKFRQNENINYLFLLAVPFSLLITSKATILGMVGLATLFMFIKFRNILFTSKVIFVIGFLVLLTSLLSFENYDANKKLLSNHPVNDINMQQVADLNFIYNINFEKLYSEPFRHSHADSLIGMITLDTFGDYFQWYAYSDESAFKYIKKEFKSIWYITYWREFFSIVLTIFFYSCFIYFSITDKQNSIYYLLPFFGIFILLVQAFGFPQKNFNKATAELFKTHYYSFFLIISISYVFVKFLKSGKILAVFSFILIVFTSSYLYGFPSNDVDFYDEYLSEKNKYVTTCFINSFFINSSNSEECWNINKEICNFDDPFDELRKINSKDKVNDEQLRATTHILEKELNEEVTVSNPIDCSNYLEKGYKFKSQFTNSIKFPLVNISIFIIYILSIVMYPFYKNKI